MITLALDTATHSCGYAVFDGVSPICWGVLKEKDKLLGKRLSGLYGSILQLVRKYGVDHIVFEDTNELRNVQTLKKLCYLHGIVMAICFQENISYSSMLPSEWRKRLSFKTGSSVGQTRDVQKQLALDYVQMIMGYDVDCDDTAEALCLGVVFTSQYIGVGND